MFNRHYAFFRKQKWLILFSVGFFLLTLAGFNRLLTHVAANSGITYHDPFFDYYEALDCSLPIFILTYGTLLYFLFLHREKPEKYLYYLQAYALLVLWRTVSIYLLPLSEPQGAIPLSDPLLNTFFYPGGYSSRDLFFSGHTATLFLFALFTGGKESILFYGCTILLGVLLVLQKIHYSVDVLAAPFFAWITYKMVLIFNSRLIGGQ